MVLIVRQDLGMGKGKVAAQVIWPTLVVFLFCCNVALRTIYS